MAGSELGEPQTAIEGAQGESARSLLFLLFFISGFAALTYQIVWQRALFAIYGINVESVTVVVSAFMLGLGAGSLIGGYISTLNVPLVLVFAIAELGTAAFGFISLRLFKFVAVYTAGVNVFTTGILAFLLVLVPTILMGSTLPVLVTYCVRVIPNVGRWTGSLYYVNTLGSAIGCFFAAMFGMRTFGESGWVAVAACINLLVGTAALIHFYTSKRAESGPLPTASEPQGAKLLPFWLGVLVSGVSGLIALSYEIIWYRVFSFSTAGRAYTFAYLLGMYLNGIAFGALVAERICRDPQTGDRQRRLAGVLIVFGNLVAFVLAPIASYGSKAIRLPLVLMLLVPFGALLLGTIFPLICQLTIVPDRNSGSRLSQIYFSNIVGSTLGSFLVGYVLMDFLSTAQVSILLVICGSLLGLTLLVWNDRGQWKNALALAVVCIVIVAVIRPSFTAMYERLLLNHPSAPKFEYLVENKSGVVAVLPNGTVIGGGVYDGRFNTDPVDDSNGIFRAYALSALHPAPSNVLMIGLASGSWAQVIANNPKVEHLTVIEINPAYLSLIARYDEVRSILSNPKISIEIDDGRRWLRRHPDRAFDAIIMNTTFHWRASATNLLSVEFLELVRQHLKPGGIAYYNATDSPEVEVTAATVFPYSVRMFNFMVVSDSPLEVDKERWLQSMQTYTIDGRPVLDPRNQPANQKVLNQYAGWVDTAHAGSPTNVIEYGDTILSRYKGRTVITDDNMACEWGE